MPRPIAITAHTMTHAGGVGVESTWQSLRSGTPATTAPPFALDYDAVVGLVAPELPKLPERWSEFDTRQARLAWMSLEEIRPAIENARARWGGGRIGLILGTSNGGIDATERTVATYLADPDRRRLAHLGTRHAFDAASRMIADECGLEGPSLVISTACSSSAKALASAQRWIESGWVDAVLVGAVDALTRLTCDGFRSLGLLSPSGCRPFDVARAGIHLGEGGAWLMLERDGDAPVDLLSVGESSDAHSMTAPHPEGLGAVAAMRAALDRAGVAPEEVDYVNAHGTGTEQNDVTEALALRTVFAEVPAFGSTKGTTGHLLGAAGGTEAVIAVEAIRRGELPPTAGLSEVDPALGVQPLSTLVVAPVRTVLSNSFAFGGSNASVLLRAR